jgi:hypothetical protein
LRGSDHRPPLLDRDGERSCDSTLIAATGDRNSQRADLDVAIDLPAPGAS